MERKKSREGEKREGKEKRTEEEEMRDVEGTKGRKRIRVCDGKERVRDLKDEYNKKGRRKGEKDYKA